MNFEDKLKNENPDAMLELCDHIIRRLFVCLNKKRFNDLQDRQWPKSQAAKIKKKREKPARQPF